MSTFEENMRLPKQELFEKTEVVSNKLIEGLKKWVGFEDKQWTQQEKVNGRTINYRDFWCKLSREPEAKDVLYWLRKFEYVRVRIQDFHPE